MEKTTPGPWLLGSWTIFDTDREAQHKGKPFWTFVESETWDSIAQGPYGRKSLTPERVITGTGYEYDGIYGSDADIALICAAPELFAVVKEMQQYIVAVNPNLDDSFIKRVDLAIAKAEGKARRLREGSGRRK